MHQTLDQMAIELAILLPLAVVAIMAAVRVGMFRPSALTGVPDRVGVLTQVDLFMCLAVMMAGMAVVAPVLERLGLLPGQTGEGVAPGELDAMAVACRALVVQALVQLPVVLVVVVRVCVTKEVGRLGLKPYRAFREVGIGLAAVVAVLPVMFALTQICSLLGLLLLGEAPPAIGHELLAVLRESDSTQATALLLMSAIVLAPLFEEVIFRGLLQTSLLSVLGPPQRWTVILIAAGVFTFIHMGVAWQVLPALFVLGIVLGWLYEKTGSLLPGVTTHAAFNAVNVVLATLIA